MLTGRTAKRLRQRPEALRLAGRDYGSPLRPMTDRFIIEVSTTGRFAVCHESWFHRRDEEREASRRMWEEFDRTRPLSDRQHPEEEREVILQEPETPRLVTKD
jgi:hypothetical protein